MIDVRMFTVGPVQENCFIVRAKDSDRGLIVDPGDEADRILQAVRDLGIQQVEAILGPLRLPLGVAVAARIPTPSGTETRLQPSDVIHAINGDFVKSVAELRSALERIKPGDPVALLIERAGQIQYLAFNLE